MTAEKSLSDLAFAVRSVERLVSATPDEIERLIALNVALAQQIQRLEK